MSQLFTQAFLDERVNAFRRDDSAGCTVQTRRQVSGSTGSLSLVEQHECGAMFYFPRLEDKTYVSCLNGHTWQDRAIGQDFIL
jgi:hypothetical protein